MLDHLGRWNHYDIIVVALFVCMTKIDLDIMGELTFEVYTYTLKGTCNAAHEWSGGVTMCLHIRSTPPPIPSCKLRLLPSTQGWNSALTVRHDCECRCIHVLHGGGAVAADWTPPSSRGSSITL
jgi:hypothetical protein